jgi:hypothetical protein
MRYVDSKWCVCVENELTPSSILACGRFEGDKLGNLPNRPPSALMIPPEERGPGRQCLGVGAPSVRSHPGWCTWPPPFSSWLLRGPGLCPRRCLA